MILGAFSFSISKTNSMTLSQIMNKAHEIAKTLTGNYIACLSYGLKKAHALANRIKALRKVDMSLSSLAKANKIGEEKEAIERAKRLEQDAKECAAIRRTAPKKTKACAWIAAMMATSSRKGRVSVQCRY